MAWGTNSLVRAGFLKDHAHICIQVLRLVDLVMVVISGIGSYHFLFSSLEPSFEYKIKIILQALLCSVFFEFLHLYRAWRGRRVRDEFALITTALALALTAGIGIDIVLLPEFTHTENRYWVLMWFISACTLLAASRWVLRRALGWLRSHGWDQRRIMIVGMSEMAVLTARQLTENAPWTGMQVVGYLDDRHEPRFDLEPHLPRLGNVKDVAPIVERLSVDQIWVTYPFRGEHRAKEVVHELRHSAVNIRFVIDLFSFDMMNRSLSNVAGIPVLDISVSPLDGLSRYVKELEDHLSALAILIVASPLLLAIVIGVKLSSPGPVFYRQERVGWNNRPFMMLKFRSMPVNTEAQSGPVWARAGENRATPFGAFLRRTSLDELPQFINVLKGEMSIIGPRPERRAFVDKFKNEVPNYMKKHMVKAGITGWAQVNGWRGDTDLNKRIEHDLYYIQNWSLWFDLRIAVQTVFSGFFNKNAY